MKALVWCKGSDIPAVWDVSVRNLASLSAYLNENKFIQAEYQGETILINTDEISTVKGVHD